MRSLNKLARRALQPLVDIYAIPPTVWNGILAGTLVPYLFISAFVGVIGNIQTMLLFLSFGFLVVAPIILVILPLIFAGARKMSRLHVLHVAFIGGLIPALLMLALALYSALPIQRGSSWYSNGTHYVIDGRLTADGFFSLLVRGPLMVFPVGILGGIVGWIVAFGFRVRVSREAYSEPDQDPSGGSA